VGENIRGDLYPMVEGKEKSCHYLPAAKTEGGTRSTRRIDKNRKVIKILIYITLYEFNNYRKFKTYRINVYLEDCREEFNRKIKIL